MISAKDMFYDERSDETYEEVMNWHKPKPKALTAMDKLKQSNQEIIETRLKLDKLKQNHKELIQLAVDEIFSFYDFGQNVKESIVKNMAEQLETPYFYISPFSDAFGSYGRFQGEKNHHGNCIRNPFFNWDSEQGEKAKHSEKFYNRKYNS